MQDMNKEVELESSPSRIKRFIVKNHGASNKVHQKEADLKNPSSENNSLVRQMFIKNVSSMHDIKLPSKDGGKISLISEEIFTPLKKRTHSRMETDKRTNSRMESGIPVGSPKPHMSPPGTALTSKLTKHSDSIIPQALVSPLRKLAGRNSVSIQGVGEDVTS